MKNETYRQGDVLIRRIEAIPLRRRAVAEGEPARIVLAFGEQTGHSHTIEARPDEARLRKSTPTRREPERTFLEVLSPSVTLNHDEHEPIEIPQGDYEIIRQREYDPKAAAEVRRVAD